jgi:hypothetical protein
MNGSLWRQVCLIRGAYLETCSNRQDVLGPNDEIQARWTETHDSVAG